MQGLTDIGIRRIHGYRMGYPSTDTDTKKSENGYGYGYKNFRFEYYYVNGQLFYQTKKLKKVYTSVRTDMI